MSKKECTVHSGCHGHKCRKEATKIFKYIANKKETVDYLCEDHFKSFTAAGCIATTGGSITIEDYYKKG